MSRPTVMTGNVIQEICTRLAEGESLRAICKDESMPAISTVLLAVVQDRDGFRNSYTQAREAAGYAHGDGVIEVVELLRDGVIDPQTGKAMMDGLKWAAERMAPKAHGTKQQVDLTSSDGSMTPKVLPTMSAAEAAQAYQDMMAGK